MLFSIFLEYFILSGIKYLILFPISIFTKIGLWHSNLCKKHIRDGVTKWLWFYIYVKHTLNSTFHIYDAKQTVKRLWKDRKYKILCWRIKIWKFWEKIVWNYLRCIKSIMYVIFSIIIKRLFISRAFKYFKFIL